MFNNLNTIKMEIKLKNKLNDFNKKETSKNDNTDISINDLIELIFYNPLNTLSMITDILKFEEKIN